MTILPVVLIYPILHRVAPDAIRSRKNRCILYRKRYTWLVYADNQRENRTTNLPDTTR